MAKKKTRKKVIKPPKPKVDTVFNCPACGCKSTVECKMDRKQKKGYLKCVNCGEGHEGTLKRITEAIDVYYQWLDKRREEKRKEEKEREKHKGENEEEEDEDEDSNNKKEYSENEEKEGEDEAEEKEE